MGGTANGGLVRTGPAIILDHLRRTLVAPLAGRPDGELLRLFALGGPGAVSAFEAIVRRHGPLVWAACRAALGDSHDAEDAFQATFVVLARKSHSLRRPESLGPWLFGVARHVSARARDAAARRRRHERRAAATEGGRAPEGLAPDEVALLHAEVGRLPERLRAAVILCDLGGLGYQEAAERLGVPHATLRGRLVRARERLRRRLTRLGFGPGAALALAPVSVPRLLVQATTRSASAFAAGGFVPESVLLLTNGGLPMFLAKCKMVGLSALTAGVLVAGAVGLSGQALTPAPDPRPVTAGIGVQALSNTRASARDDGDAVADLVRRAQRLQDRGDAAGALEALRQAEEAMRNWQTHLRRDRDRDHRDEGHTGPVRPGAGADRPSGIGALGPVAATPGEGAALPGTNSFGRRPGATTSAAPGVPMKPSDGRDLEDRLRKVEVKLDQLLRALERQPDGPTRPAP
jgi:RNA polymerase sigma factor (sigma-70 family)